MECGQCAFQCNMLLIHWILRLIFYFYFYIRILLTNWILHFSLELHTIDGRWVYSNNSNELMNGRRVFYNLHIQCVQSFCHFKNSFSRFEHRTFRFVYSFRMAVLNIVYSAIADPALIYHRTIEIFSKESNTPFLLSVDCWCLFWYSNLAWFIIKTDSALFGRFYQFIKL